MMLTWGVSGRGASRVAAVFCMGCREVLARDLLLNEAHIAVQKFTPLHKCKERSNPDAQA